MFFENTLTLDKKDEESKGSEEDEEEENFLNSVIPKKIKRNSFENLKLKNEIS